MGSKDERNQDMANEVESTQDLDSPDDEDIDMDEALEKFGKFREARRALPWSEWTRMEKANFYLDRMFLGFLAIFLVVFLCDFIYKMWWVTNVKAIAAFVSAVIEFLFELLLAIPALVSDVTEMLFGWLFAQGGQEQRKEL